MEEQTINKSDFKEGTIEYFIEEATRDKAILEVLEDNKTYDMLWKKLQNINWCGNIN